MWFKNLHIFRLLEPFALSPEALHEELSKAIFHSCGRMDMESLGWIPPLGGENESLTYSYNNCILFTLRKEEKILPASVVREFVNEKVEEIETQNMRKVRKREKDDIREEILQDLIPRAFTRSHYLSAYLDVTHNWLLIDTGSRKKAEELTQFLRTTLGSLPIISPQLREKLDSVMTGWLVNDNELPHDLELADACVLMDKAQEGAIVNCKRQDLQAKEIQGHLAAGKSVIRLALQWDERLGFVIDNELVIRRIQLLELVQSQLHENEADTPELRFEADFQIMTTELTRLITRLFEIFGGEDEAAYAKKR